MVLFQDPILFPVFCFMTHPCSNSIIESCNSVTLLWWTDLVPNKLHKNDLWTGSKKKSQKLVLACRLKGFCVLSTVFCLYQTQVHTSLSWSLCFVKLKYPHRGRQHSIVSELLSDTSSCVCLWQLLTLQFFLTIHAGVSLKIVRRI